LIPPGRRVWGAAAHLDRECSSRWEPAGVRGVPGGSRAAVSFGSSGTAADLLPADWWTAGPGLAVPPQEHGQALCKHVDV
jgi:hypothetical protein